MTQLSVVITTHNNQDMIADCLKSVSFAEEIIVIDNESTDDTAMIAKKHGATVYPYKNNPKNLNQSKNYGFTKARNEWILSLDSDERIEADLASEINSIVSNESAETSGYLIPRKNIIFGKWIRHGLWYPDHQLRLFIKGRGKFPELHNHELLVVTGRVGELKGHIYHLNYQTVSQYIKKIDQQYSDNEAETFLKKDYKLHWHDAIRFPFQDFLTNYFARESYKDGLHGLVLSLLQAFYMFIVFCKIWERQGFAEQKVILSDVETEFKRNRKQLKHWFIQVKLPHSNLIEKLRLKLLSKLP